MLLAGCGVRVATDVVIAPDGSGDVALRVVVDDELRDRLASGGLELAGALPSPPTGGVWSVEDVAEPDATGVVLRASFEEPAGLGAAVAALTASLDPDDGALLDEVELVRTAGGGYRLELLAGIDAPVVAGLATTVPGVDAVGVADLDDLLARGGDDVASATLTVTLPTTPTIEQGSGSVTDRTATLVLPTGSLGRVVVTAPPPPTLPLRESLAVLALVVGAVLLLGATWWRRR
jgi:hypothetical protein